MKLSLMTTLILTVVFAISLVHADQKAAPDQIIMPGKMGAVTFPHQLHQQQYACQSCHHTGNFENCSQCHAPGKEGPSRKIAFHALCKDCHAQVNNAPVKCKECHQK